MLRKEDWMEIRAQIEKGVYQKDVAWELGVHPKTVGRALKRGGPPPESGPGAKVSVLEPFKSAVDKLLREGVWNAVVIHKQIGLQGYLGGITILRDYVRPMRPMRESRATVRFETAPGEQLQSDWGEHEVLLAGQQRKVHFIVNTLGYSRRFHFWCTERNDAEHTYEGLARSFEYFGGGTREVLVDNQKAAVITHRIGERVRFNERFLDFAGHYGFTPRACRPYRARTKGKDERMVGYVKGNFFLQYREFESMSHLNELAGKWLDEVADKRFHGTVKEVVSDRFARELPHLYPLPTVRFDTSYLEHRFVSWDGYVEVRGNRYSVPANLCGSMVTIRIGLKGNLRVYADEVLVAEHTLRRAAEGWVSIPSHHVALWQRALQVERRDLACYEEVIQWN
jgi:transposase